MTRLYIGPVRIPLWLWRIMGARVECEVVYTEAFSPLTWPKPPCRYTGRKRLASRFGPLTPWMDRPIWRIG